MNTGLLTILANWSQTAVAGTASGPLLGDISADDESGIVGYVAPCEAPRLTPA